MDVINSAGKAEAVPRLESLEREARRRMVFRPHAELIQGSVIVGSKTLKEAVNESFALIRSVGELVPVEVIKARGDYDAAEDIEGRIQTLDKVVDQVVIGIGSVVKQGPKGRLPFLCLQHSAGVRLPCHERFEIQLADGPALGTR